MDFAVLIAFTITTTIDHVKAFLNEAIHLWLACTIRSAHQTPVEGLPRGHVKKMVTAPLANATNTLRSTKTGFVHRTTMNNAAFCWRPRTILTYDTFAIVMRIMNVPFAKVQMGDKYTVTNTTAFQMIIL